MWSKTGIGLERLGLDRLELKSLGLFGWSQNFSSGLLCVAIDPILICLAGLNIRLMARLEPKASV